MKLLAVLSGTIAFLCLIIGVVTLLGLLSPLSSLETAPLPQWIFWFGLSALLFLASIACKPSGGGGGGEY